MSTPVIDATTTSKPGRGLDITLLVVLIGLLAVSLWGSGLFDSEIQREIRVSNVYAEAGVDVDEAEAEQIIGNRQLVVVMLDTPLERRGGDICDDLKTVASGSIAVILGSDMRTYGCALIAGYDDENFGKAFVAESQIGRGLAELEDRPLEAMQAMAVNFDLLVNAGIAPQESRSIDPPLGRFVIAGITLGAVLIGALLVYVRGRRVAQLQAQVIQERNEARGRLAERDSALASAGVQILALDERYREVTATGYSASSSDKKFIRRYTEALKSYTDLNAKATDHDPTDVELTRQLRAAEELNEKLSRL